MQRTLRKRSSIYLGAILLIVLTTAVSLAFKGIIVQNASASVDAGHQPLPANDGWATSNGGTTGGSNASSANVYTVSNRTQLVSALGGNSGSNTTAKIIYINGTIDGNEDNSGNALSCSNYVTNGYSLSAYLKAYDPAVWGTSKVPSGAQESARQASENNQAKQVEIRIPSNTTIVGVGSTARVLGADFMISSVSNVIIRNIQFENAFDCFPQWDPTDGSTGNWNSAFDNMTILGSTHIWVDHNTFTDGSLPDSQEPRYFGREYEQHDGEMDITKGADLVTASWNRFTNHDKTTLIGSTDSPTYDVGKLRVTLHHNEYENVIQREPRVRYGQVHVYDNYYNQSSNSSLEYALGVGISSAIYDQNNNYALPSGFSAAKVISVLKGTAIHTEGDIVNGASVDLLAAYNAANSPALSSNVGWTPQYHLTVDSAASVPSLVTSNAGVGHDLTRF